jgi:transposase
VDAALLVQSQTQHGITLVGPTRGNPTWQAKTQLQHIVTAAALNLDRLVAWLHDLPRATTPISRFAALAPA